MDKQASESLYISECSRIEKGRFFLDYMTPLAFPGQGPRELNLKLGGAGEWRGILRDSRQDKLSQRDGDIEKGQF